MKICIGINGVAKAMTKNSGLIRSFVFGLFTLKNAILRYLLPVLDRVLQNMKTHSRDLIIQFVNIQGVPYWYLFILMGDSWLDSMSTSSYGLIP